METTINLTNSNLSQADTQMNCSTSSTKISSELIIHPEFKLDSQVILKSNSTSFMVELINEDQIEYGKRKKENENKNEEYCLPKLQLDESFASKSNDTSFKSSKFPSQLSMLEQPLDSDNESNSEAKQRDSIQTQSDSDSNLVFPDFSIQKNEQNLCSIKSQDDLQSIEQTASKIIGHLLVNKNCKTNLKNTTLSNSDDNEKIDDKSNSATSTISTKMTSSLLSICMKDSVQVSLKRAQGIPDLHNMNTLSDSCILNDTSNESSSKLDNPITDNMSSSKSINYIEESKILMDGINVRAADLTNLVQILIDSFDENGNVINYSNYPRVFFLMHKWFIESYDMAKLLLDLYQKYEIESKENQLKTCHAFRFWIKHFPAHFGIDECMKMMITNFSSLVRSKGHKDHLRYIEVANIESYDWIRKQTKRNPIKSKSKTEKKSELAFDKLGPDIIASQFTYLEWKTLRRITFNEYKSYADKGIIHDNPLLERSIQLFNGMSQWIQTMVLKKTTAKQRAERIHKFIQVAQHLRQLQNFNSLMAVVGGICHSSIVRLSKTNSHLSVEDQKTLNDLMELLSSNFNYAQYRKTINELKGFFIPIIGIHLKDIISLHTAHMDKLDNNLINFRKMVQLSVIFQSLNDLQNSESPVQPNTSGYLEVLQVALEMFYCEDEIYERSLNMEPRTSISSPTSPEKRQEFADWAKSMSTPLDPRTIKKHVNDMVNTVFKNYDHDNDGFISNEEFNEIAQNFPFIDSFAVLDADKDGLISPEEMQTYFLKANHQALKNEFKHDFHEWTYYKPTYCILCDGLLWGLIKQGWKCVDCRINAHKHCKETLVMECRSKRPIELTRQMSNSGAEQLTRNRSTSIHNRKNVYPNQKSLQADAYDDIFLTDESTEEEDNNNDISFISSTTSNSLLRSNDGTDLSTSRLLHQHRLKRYKKSPKRRKSLPPQSGSIKSEVRVNVRPTCLPNALIPRGPLICSNIENLENHRIPSERTFCPSNIKNSSRPVDSSDHKQNTESSNSSLEYNGISNKDNLKRIYKVIDMVSQMNDKKSLAMPEETTDIDFNISLNNFKPSQIHSADTVETKSNLLDCNRHIANNRVHSLNQKESNKTLKNTSCNQNSKSLEDPSFINKQTSPDSYDYFAKIISLKQKVNSNDMKSKESSKKHGHRNKKDSDYDIDDFIEESLLSDAFSSNEEESDVFIKLKEEERKRINLERENEKIKKELESANAQITTLRNVMSTIVSSDKINLIQNKMELFNLKKKDSEA